MTYSQEKAETSAATAISGSRVAGRAASGSPLVPLAPLEVGSSIVLDIYPTWCQNSSTALGYMR